MTDQDKADLGRMATHFEALDDPWSDFGSTIRAAAILCIAGAFVAGVLVGSGAVLWVVM